MMKSIYLIFLIIALSSISSVYTYSDRDPHQRLKHDVLFELLRHKNNKYLSSFIFDTCETLSCFVQEMGERNFLKWFESIGKDRRHYYGQDKINYDDLRYRIMKAYAYTHTTDPLVKWLTNYPHSTC